MPRPTKQMKALIDTIDQLQAQLAINGTITAGLRKDLEGACRGSRDLAATVHALRQEANEDDQHIKELEAEFEALAMKHNRVCCMWAEMAAQFEGVDIGQRN